MCVTHYTVDPVRVQLTSTSVLSVVLFRDLNSFVSLTDYKKESKNT